MELNKIHQGDCIEVLKTLPENSVDAIVTDPPYGLEFMGKNWDFGVPGKLFFEEMIRVLKPGGFLLAFGGTRTYHRLACGIEDAGFEIRDCIQWLYGSGFPKSLNIGKQIDKMADKDLEVIEAKKKLGEWLKEKRGNRPQKEVSQHFPSKTGRLTGCVANWELGLNIPTWEIWIKLKKILELDDRFDYLIEGRPNNYIPAEREVIGKNKTGNPVNWFANMDSKPRGDGVVDITKASTNEAKEWEGWGTALKPANEPIVVARKPLSEKNVALNVLKWGTGGINIDACRIGTDKSDKNWRVNPSVRNKETEKHLYGDYGEHKTHNLKEQGRFPANIILDEEAGKMLGEPSRFFYCAKASKSERNKGCEKLEEKTTDDGIEVVSNRPHQRGATQRKNNHPTVKPIKLMEYLIKLVSKEEAIILDPFLGSGTTAIAAVKLNRKFIGIEKEEEYIKIAQARLNHYTKQTKLQF